MLCRTIDRKRVVQQHGSEVKDAVIVLNTSLNTSLPCSSGPCMVDLSLLSTFRKPVQAYLLLTVCNIIFVTPLVGIPVTVLVSSGLTRKIKTFSSTKLGTMELISGTLLVAALIYRAGYLLRRAGS